VSWFFIKSGLREKKANLYQGLMLLSLSLMIFEELLNDTGYIVFLLPISNYSEPLNLAVGPLFYLYVKNSLSPSEKRNSYLHFVPMLFWILYMVFYFIQSDEIKYNSYLWAKHPDWQTLDVIYHISEDPLEIRDYINTFTGISFTIYLIGSGVLIQKRLKSLSQSFFKIEEDHLKVIRNSIFHFLIILTSYLFVKIFIGRDTGDYIPALYISFMIYATSYKLLGNSRFLDNPHFFLEFPNIKYRKSSLSETDKDLILEKIKSEMGIKMYFVNNMASLSDLGKKIHHSSHHVSQVINEKLNKNFFELLAGYRIEYARKLIIEDKENKLTVEELAEIVGYNSKSSFNSAFKTITSKTPSEYRKSVADN
jgi:AraC-like DNA-binding protein